MVSHQHLLPTKVIATWSSWKLFVLSCDFSEPVEFLIATEIQEKYCLTGSEDESPTPAPTEPRGVIFQTLPEADAIRMIFREFPTVDIKGFSGIGNLLLIIVQEYYDQATFSFHIFLYVKILSIVRKTLIMHSWAGCRHRRNWGGCKHWRDCFPLYR